jgi:hypothetical protein
MSVQRVISVRRKSSESSLITSAAEGYAADFGPL